MTNINEIWKDISSYEGLYQVSSSGRVRSVEFRQSMPWIKGNPTRIRKGRLIKPGNHSNGYLRVGVSNGKAKHHYVHRLVAFAFLVKSEDSIEVNHIDGNKKNNDLSNLEWCSKSHNCQHAYDTGLQPVRYAMNSAKRKLEEYQVRNARALHKQGYLIKDIAKIYSVTATAISGIVNGKAWTYLTD